jgi:hypothetical protein
MEFAPEKVDDFKRLFEEVKEKIAGFPGCYHVELCADATFPTVFYTFSKWENEAALEAYRTSELFTTTWARTKVLFGGRPLAYSLIQV